jgi:hypothetical protein
MRLQCLGKRIWWSQKIHLLLEIIHETPMHHHQEYKEFKA